eukprot:Phypoly_transcript_04875.p1 GENE.Phypoly_transcript_04875~~Phypoly_transcript_04875.p1  ORF type:complete len:348 (+),score=37.62 Phypoly_transcript_04875:936-1979(+)
MFPKSDTRFKTQNRFLQIRGNLFILYLFNSSSCLYKKLASSDMDVSTDESFRGEVILAGKSNVNFINATLPALSFANYGSQPAKVNILVNQLTLFAPTLLTIPGNVTVNGELVLNGQYHITGSLLQYSGTMDLVGSDPRLQVDGSINLISADGQPNHPQFTVNGVIECPNTVLAPQSTLSISKGFVAFYGKIASSGTLLIPGGSLLYLNGSFTSAADSVVRITDLVSSDTPRIQIDQAAYLVDGTIEYTIQGTPVKASPYFVLMAGSIKGDLGGGAPKDISDKTKGNLIFENNKLYIKFDGEVKHHRGMPWYGWFLILIGLGSIGGFVYVYRKRRLLARQGYDRVEM